MNQNAKIRYLISYHPVVGSFALTPVCLADKDPCFLLNVGSGNIIFCECIFLVFSEQMLKFIHCALFFFSYVMSVGVLTLNGLVWLMGSGFVLSALASTGAWEYIWGKTSDLYYGFDNSGVLARSDNDLFCLICSFVRSVTMDKWKDIELEKMKVGGNGEFRKFLELQDDYDPTWNLQEKYNSKPAALFRDKVRCAPLRPVPQSLTNKLFSTLMVD